MQTILLIIYEKFAVIKTHIDLFPYWKERTSVLVLKPTGIALLHATTLNKVVFIEYFCRILLIKERWGHNLGTIQAIIYFEHAISKQGVRMISFSYHRSVLFPKKFELVTRILFLHFQWRLYITGKPPMLWTHFSVICLLLHWSIT